MPQYDAIIIGAGNGGLSAALTLARAGKKVAVFEKHNIPGGCGTSFCRGRFEFEVALHQLSSMGTPEQPGDLRKLFDEYGITDKIDWIQIESLYKINLPGGKGVALPADREKAEQTLIKAFPEEKEAIHKYYETVWEFNREIIAFTKKSAESSRNGKKSGEPSAVKKLIMKALFPKLYPTLAKYAVKSTDDVLNEFFKSKELQL